VTEALDEWLHAGACRYYAPGTPVTEPGLSASSFFLVLRSLRHRIFESANTPQQYPTKATLYRRKIGPKSHKHELCRIPLRQETHWPARSVFYSASPEPLKRRAIQRRYQTLRFAEPLHLLGVRRGRRVAEHKYRTLKFPGKSYQ